jgi:hypothetical protein
MLTTLRIYGLSIAVLTLGTVASAEAGTTVTEAIFATAPAGSSAPDSITTGNGSVWVEYGNGVDSTGVIPGFSTIVQYSSISGMVQHTYSISGLVDGLKYNPTTGMVWALQNNDANATLSLINPATHAVSGPLFYAAPPYAYGANCPPATTSCNNGRGYDDVAFLNGQVYLSYTNPANPTDPVLHRLDQGNNPSGTLNTTTILTAIDVNSAFTDSSLPGPDIDSLKSTPNGELVLTSEGDSPGMGLPPPPSTAGEYTLIAHPGTPQQKVTNVLVTDAGVNVFGIDDVIFLGLALCRQHGERRSL